ncbi:MAG: hypothetical protein ACKOAW_04960, partial [Actinomycetota bacterium]
MDGRSAPGGPRPLGHPPPVIELSADEARRASLWAQGLLGSRKPQRSPAAREAAVLGMLEHLGAVQLDT